MQAQGSISAPAQAPTNKESAHSPYTLESDIDLDIAGVYRRTVLTVKSHGSPVGPGITVRLHPSAQYPNLRGIMRRTDPQGRIVLRGLIVRAGVEPLRATIDGYTGITYSPAGVVSATSSPAPERTAETPLLHADKVAEPVASETVPDPALAPSASASAVSRFERLASFFAPSVANAAPAVTPAVPAVQPAVPAAPPIKSPAPRMQQYTPAPRPATVQPPRAQPALTAEPYIVQSGDTAETVAAKFGMSVPQLLGMNQFKQAEDVKPGRSIMVVGKAGMPRTQTGRPGVAPGGLNISPDIAGINTNSLAMSGFAGAAAAQAKEGAGPVTGAVREAASAAASSQPKDAPESAMKVSGFKGGSGPSATAPAPNLQGQPKDNTPGANLATEKGLPQDENIQKFREIVEDSSWQEVVPNKRVFVQFSRYFVNQVSCPGGKFVQALMPQDKFVETELSENGSDFFLRVGNNPDKQFPLDLVLICEDQTFMLNAVVHTGVPSQLIRLKLPRKVKQAADLARVKPMIEQAQALPQEEQLVRIARRIYKEDYLSYWEENMSAAVRHKWYVRPYTIVVNNVVKTYINGYVAWDFLVKGYEDGDDDALRRELQRAVRGKPVAVGKVTGPTTARFIVITQEAGDLKASRKGVMP
jgi:LysM repeat protein